MCLKNSKDLLALTLSNNIYKIIGIPFWTRLIDMRQHKIKTFNRIHSICSVEFKNSANFDDVFEKQRPTNISFLYLY